jgi:hypothetical protein
LPLTYFARRRRDERDSLELGAAQEEISALPTC